MKKNIAKKIISTVPILSVFPFTLSSSVNSNVKKSTKENYTNFITKPFNYRDFETQLSNLKNSKKSLGWKAEYSKRDWKNIIDPKMDFDYALKYGWQSLRDWEMYARYVYENNYGKINNQFGYFNKDNANWIAWHYSPGMALGSSYSDGTSSPVRPTWLGAEEDPINKIDNKLKWFAYDQGGFFFLYNQNHINDAWKRLKFEKRIKPISYSKIISEKNANNKKRNYFMVNGKIIKLKDLSKYKTYYYVTTDGESDIVKDSYGWKALITNEDLSILNKPINPLNSSIDPPKPKSEDYITQVNLKYPDDYLMNKEMLTNSDKERNGKYIITYKYDSFTSLTKDETLIMPQEIMSTWSQPDNKYGNSQTKSLFSHGWAGGGYMFAWVEDGKGGHKVYKSLKTLEARVKYENNGKFLMYGNWHHVFPAKGKEWFKDIQEIYSDSHLD